MSKRLGCKGRQRVKRALVILPPERVPLPKPFQQKPNLENCFLPSEIVWENNLIWVASFLEGTGANFSKRDFWVAVYHLKIMMNVWLITYIICWKLLVIAE